MKFCGNCGRQLADDALFCDACGTRSAAQPAPSVANVEPTNSQPVACPVQPQPPVPEQAAPSGVKEKKKKSKKTLVIVLVVALILAAAAVAAWWLLGRGPKDPSSLASAEPYTDYALYVKDNAVYYVDLNDLESHYIYGHDGENSTFLNYFGDYESDMLGGAGVKVSRNGKALVYCKYSGGSSELYYRNLEDSNEEILIDKLKNGGDIRGYHISDDGKMVTYIKRIYPSETGAGGSCSVYQFNGTEKEKLFSVKGSEGIYGFAVSPDGKQIFYDIMADPEYWAVVKDEKDVPEEYGCFWWRKGKGSEKIGSVFTDFMISPDVSTVCYIAHMSKDDAGTLYRKKFGEKPQILAQDVSRMESQHLRWANTWYSEDLSTVYYEGTDGHRYKADAEGNIKQVEAVEYYRSWPEITFEAESQSDTVEYGALYMDGVLVDEKASRGTISWAFMPTYLTESQLLIYFKDANIVSGTYTKEQGATMMLYNGEESIKVGTNVFDYHVVSNSRIFYWCQADNDKYPYEVYDLYYFDGQKSHLIQRDAQGFLSVWKTPAYRPELD